MHDITKGFHDIKPMPKFYPIPDYITILLWIALILLVILITRKLLAHFNRKNTHTSMLSPKELAYSKLLELESQFNNSSISPKDYASGISLILRNYLETRYCFPAAEQTVNEISINLPNYINEQLGAHKMDNQLHDFTKLSTSFLSILKQCEKITFTNQAYLSTEDLNSLSKLLKEIIHINEFLFKEDSNEI